MRLIQGVELREHRIHDDARGQLVALEDETLPFPLRRVFFMKVDEAGVVRGGHANSCDEYIVALSGSVVIEVDNGLEQARTRLDRHDRALWIRPGVLIHLRSFAPGTLLLVCASESYGRTRHFAHPRPELMGALCSA